MRALPFSFLLSAATRQQGRSWGPWRLWAGLSRLTPQLPEALGASLLCWPPCQVPLHPRVSGAGRAAISCLLMRRDQVFGQPASSLHGQPVFRWRVPGEAADCAQSPRQRRKIGSMEALGVLPISSRDSHRRRHLQALGACCLHCGNSTRLFTRPAAQPSTLAAPFTQLRSQISNLVCCRYIFFKPS